MSKMQRACKAVIYWDEVATKAEERKMAGIRTAGEDKGETSEILAKRFGVSNGYIKQARKLLLIDPERFQRVLCGLESLPYATGKLKTTSDSFALYRAFDSQGDLLYVGITFSVGNRMSGHAKTSEWWDFFSYMTVERNFSTREELVDAEERAILMERPRFNVNTKGR